MRLRRSTRAAAFAVAVAGFVGSMTGIAWAPKNLSVHVIEAACDVKDAGSGEFVGSVTLTGFTLVKNQLFGVATVSGTCTLPNGTRVVTSERERALVPVSIQELSCAKLDLLLADVSIGTTTLRTGGMHLFVFPGSKGDEAKLCAAADMAARRSVAEMLTPLSHLLFH
ncbi:MAG TPA: hypothetical protein VEU29_02165 [Actinomycetota bacterium]|nr:hypothetical protein [Actinomycetota bacterium]